MSDCIIFGGAIGSTGYGSKWRNGRMVGAHRAAYEDANGPIPAGLMVLHSCDNKACVNPQHLRLGTARDNAADAVARGQIATGLRHGRHTSPESRRLGSENPMSYLSPARVAEARAMRANGAKLREIAGRIGTTISTASRLCRGETYLLESLEQQP